MVYKVAKVFLNIILGDNILHLRILEHFFLYIETLLNIVF